jgi:hypothetical protein
MLGECFCNPGFVGEDCIKPVKCPGKNGGCSGKGECFHGKCYCSPGLKVKIVPNAKNAQMAVAPTVSAAAADAYAYQVTLAKIAPMHLHARKIHVKMVYVHKDVVSVMMDGLAKHVH